MNRPAHLAVVVLKRDVGQHSRPLYERKLLTRVRAEWYVDIPWGWDCLYDLDDPRVLAWVDELPGVVGTVPVVRDVREVKGVGAPI